MVLPPKLLTPDPGFDSMPDPARDQQVLQSELRLLQALCQGTPQGSLRQAAGTMLAKYRWREPLHQIVFELLVSFPSDDIRLLRDELPSKLTRRGFPDVAWEDFFAPHSLSREDAERLVRELRDSS